MSGPENDLSSTLARQAEQFARRGGAELDLAQVVSRAGEIRRGRRMRATIAMAAVVLAVAVPVGGTVIGNDPTKPEQVQPADQPNLSALTTDGLDTGEEPASGFARDGRLQPGDYAAPLADGEEIADLTKVGDDFLVGVRDDSGNLVARYVTYDGVVGEERPASYGFGVSADGSTVVMVQPDGTVVAYADRGTEQAVVGKVPVGGSFTVSGITGENCSQAGGCTVYVSVGDEDGKVWAVSPGAEPTTVFPGLFGTIGIAADAVSGTVSVDDNEAGSCSEVRALDGTLRWKTCENSLKAFSPDGRYIVGQGPYLSGIGDGTLSVLDAATGKAVLTLETVPNATIASVTWEDADTVLATVFEDNSWAVVRVELDGSRELAIAPVQDTGDMVAPFSLVGRR